MKTTSFLFTFLIIFIVAPLFSQNGHFNIAGARASALGNTGVNFRDIQSVFSNQAGLARLENAAATVFGQQRFLLQELQQVGFGAALPTNSGTIGLNVQYFGNESYNEQKIGLAYGRKLMEKLSIGAQMNVLRTSIPEYGSLSTFTFELGLQSDINSQISLAAHLFNPLRLETVEGEILPTVLTLGAAYRPTPLTAVFLELEKDVSRPLMVKSGIEYQIVEALKLRTGIATNPTLFSFGLGLDMKKGPLIDIAASYHQLLGFSPTAGLTYRFSKSEK
jgi:hypothetical protein